MFSKMNLFFLLVGLAFMASKTNAQSFMCPPFYHTSTNFTQSYIDQVSVVAGDSMH